MSLAASSNPVVASLAGGRDTALADAGAYFVAVTPTPGTGIIGTASVQLFTETTPVFVLYNSGLLNIYPMQLRMHATVVGVTAPTIAVMYTNTLDTGNRLSSGGTALVKSNTNMNSALTSAAQITVGAVTATAASASRRIVGHFATQAANVEALHSVVTCSWGDSSPTLFSNLIDNAATLAHHAVNFAPVVVGPGQSMVFVRWSPAITTAPTLEYEFSYVEK